jgi:hypothetical protein
MKVQLLLRLIFNLSSLIFNTYYCLFTVGYLCRVLSRLHRRRGVVDNNLIFNPNRRRVCGPRTSAYRRGGRRRVVPTDWTIPQVLGRTFVIFHLERHPPHHFNRKLIINGHGEKVI